MIMNKLKSAVLISVLFASFLACNQSQNTNSTANKKETVDKTSLVPSPDVIMKDPAVNEAYKNYNSLKNALVASNVELTQKAASDLGRSLSKINGCENTASIAVKIANSVNLENQRVSFAALSADFIALLKHADVKEGTLYVQYCPMTNSGEGGYWMSSTSEIRNPYYGNKMLNCGEVKEKISKSK